MQRNWFFYVIESDGIIIPLIVSNKHVLCEKLWIEFDFALTDKSLSRINGPSKKNRIEKGQLPIFEHPDLGVDLAAMPLNPIAEFFKRSGEIPHTVTLNKNNFCPFNVQSILHPSTSILMVGFPNGIMDEANNLPVVRRGSLATSYNVNYQGETNFVVDIASFGGSSGSPVFAFFDHLIPNDQGGMTLLTAPQFYLIGVLHSGPVMTAQGKIISAPIPTNYPVAHTSVMIHLGYRVKAHRIEELVVAIKPFL